MISKCIKPFVYGGLGFVLSINDLTYKTLAFWLILGLFVIIDLSHAFD